MLTPHYRRCDDEGRTLVTAALNSTVALEVSASELRVRLAPQSSPHRTRAVAELCRQLNGENVPFPGTRLRLRYEIRQPMVHPTGQFRRGECQEVWNRDHA